MENTDGQHLFFPRVTVAEGNALALQYYLFNKHSVSTWFNSISVLSVLGRMTNKACFRGFEEFTTVGDLGKSIINVKFGMWTMCYAIVEVVKVTIIKGDKKIVTEKLIIDLHLKEWVRLIGRTWVSIGNCNGFGRENSIKFRNCLYS